MPGYINQAYGDTYTRSHESMIWPHITSLAYIFFSNQSGEQYHNHDMPESHSHTYTDTGNSLFKYYKTDRKMHFSRALST